MDPLAGTPWSSPSTVEGFVKGEPNRVLMQYAAQVRPPDDGVALDIGCGAARNALPIASLGWRVVGTDLSWPMLEAGRRKADATGNGSRLALALAPMEALPVRDRSVDLIVAHGVWNLAKSDAQFRRAVAEAARVARPGATLFVFTFSRHTVPEDARPEAGQTLTFSQFSGTPQIFLTEAQLFEELAAVGFTRDERVPLSEYNRGPRGFRTGGGPVIFEAAFTFGGRAA